RSGPKRSRSPAVARKTPPARPTSSPITSTSASRSSSTWKASLIASTRVSSAIEHPPELGQIVLEGGRRVDERVREHQRRVRRRLGFCSGDPRPHQVGGLRSHRLRGLAREQAEPPQVRLVAAAAVCAESGVEIAHWLLLQKRTSGARITAAKLAPSWKAPSEVAPSPKYTIAQFASPRSFLPQASPAAWGTCVPIGTQIEATFQS